MTRTQIARNGILASAAALSLGTFVEYSTAAAIDIHFTGSPFNNPSDVGDAAPAGAPGAADQTAYWNNLSQGAFMNDYAPSAYDYNGQQMYLDNSTSSGPSMTTFPTNMVVTSVAQTTVSDTMSSASGSTSEDLHLFEGGVAGSTGASSSTSTTQQLTLSFSNVPASFQATGYSLYVYVGAGTTNKPGTISDGTATYAFSSIVRNGGVFPGYIQSTTDNTTTPTPADYVVFNETAPSITLTAASLPGGDLAAVFGVQFVQNTPEPTALAPSLIGIPALLGRRPRKRLICRV